MAFMRLHMLHMNRLWRIVAYIWAAPNTAAGLLVGLFALTLGARVSIMSGAIEFNGGLIGKAISQSLPSCRYSAITLGHVILGVDMDSLNMFREHEHVHVRQYEQWGIFFLPAYLLSSLWQLLHGRNAYMANHFEKQAYSQASICALPATHPIQKSGENT